MDQVDCCDPIAGLPPPANVYAGEGYSSGSYHRGPNVLSFPLSRATQGNASPGMPFWHTKCFDTSFPALPYQIMAMWMGVAITGLAITLVNHVYRASVHLALLTTMVTPVVTLFGGASFIAILLMPLLGSSRYQLGKHTPGQLVLGSLLGFAVTIMVFHEFGLSPTG